MEKMESIIEICLELQRGQVGREKKRYKKGIIDKWGRGWSTSKLVCG